jgi:hypothetical protein
LLKTKKMDLRTNLHHPCYNSIKRQSTYVYKYDYIQVSGKLTCPYLQR